MQKMKSKIIRTSILSIVCMFCAFFMSIVYVQAAEAKVKSKTFNGEDVISVSVDITESESDPCYLIVKYNASHGDESTDDYVSYVHHVERGKTSLQEAATDIAQAIADDQADYYSMTSTFESLNGARCQDLIKKNVQAHYEGDNKDELYVSDSQDEEDTTNAEQRVQLADTDGTVGDNSHAAWHSDAFTRLQEDYWGARNSGKSADVEALNDFWSFYGISKAAAEYYQDVMSATDQDSDASAIQGINTVTKENQLFVGDAGVFLSNGANSSRATSDIEYTELQNVKIAGTNSDKLWAYAQYGNLLQQIGFDSTTTAESSDPMSTIAGTTLQICYHSSSLVSQVMKGAVRILQFLNPFSFFSDALNDSDQITASWGMSGLDASTTTTSAEGAEVLTAAGSANSLTTALSNLYRSFYSIGWLVVIPFSFVILIATLLLFRSSRSNAWPKIRKYITRVALILLGVPVCAMLYSMVLNGLEDAVDDSSTAASQIIMSTFLDFGDWVQEYKLAVPEGATLEAVTTASSSGTIVPSDTTLNSLQQTAYAINYYTWNGQTDTSGKNALDTSMQHSQIAASQSNDALRKSDGTDLKDTVLADFVDSMLENYISNRVYLASEFESTQTAKLTNLSDDDDISMGVMIMLDELNSIYCWGYKPVGQNAIKFSFTEPADSETEITKTYKIFQDYYAWGDGSTAVNITADSGLEASALSKGHSSTLKSYKYTESGAAKNNLKTDDMVSTGLSTMSMYNYLNTVFTDNKMTVYDPTNTSSQAVLQGHNYVTLIGDGNFMKVVYWINAVVVLLTITIMGLFYAFGLVVDSVKNAVKAIVNIPFAVIGSIRSAARMITTVVILIVEVVGTIFLYELASEMVYYVNNSFSAIFSSFFSDGQSSTVGSWTQTFVILLTTILTVWLAVTLVRFRKSILSTLEEGAESIINRILMGSEEAARMPSQVAADRQAEANKGPSVVGRALSAGVGGMASGAGMAMGRKMFGGGKSSDKGNGEDEASNEKGNGKGVSGTAGSTITQADVNAAKDKADKANKEYSDLLQNPNSNVSNDDINKASKKADQANKEYRAMVQAFGDQESQKPENQNKIREQVDGQSQIDLGENEGQDTSETVEKAQEPGENPLKPGESALPDNEETIEDQQKKEAKADNTNGEKNQVSATAKAIAADVPRNKADIEERQAARNALAKGDAQTRASQSQKEATALNGKINAITGELQQSTGTKEDLKKVNEELTKKQNAVTQAQREYDKAANGAENGTVSEQDVNKAQQALVNANKDLDTFMDKTYEQYGSYINDTYNAMQENIMKDSPLPQTATETTSSSKPKVKRLQDNSGNKD